MRFTVFIVIVFWSISSVISWLKWCCWQAFNWWVHFRFSASMSFSLSSQWQVVSFNVWFICSILLSSVRQNISFCAVCLLSARCIISHLKVWLFTHLSSVYSDSYWWSRQNHICTEDTEWCVKCRHQCLDKCTEQWQSSSSCLIWCDSFWETLHSQKSHQMHHNILWHQIESFYLHLLHYLCTELQFLMM